MPNPISYAFFSNLSRFQAKMDNGDAQAFANNEAIFYTKKNVDAPQVKEYYNEWNTYDQVLFVKKQIFLLFNCLRLS